MKDPGEAMVTYVPTSAVRGRLACPSLTAVQLVTSFLILTFFFYPRKVNQALSSHALLQMHTPPYTYTR